MDAGHPCSFCVLLGVRSAPKLVHFAPKIPGPPESMLRSQGDVLLAPPQAHCAAGNLCSAFLRARTPGNLKSLQSRDLG